MKKTRFCTGCEKTPLRADNVTGLCKSCTQARAKHVRQRPPDSLAVTGDKATLTKGTREQVRTLADLVRVCQIDTAEWIIEKWVCNAWGMGAKNAEGELESQPLYQVKAWLKRNVSVKAAKEEIASLIEDAKSQFGAAGLVDRRVSAGPPVQASHLLEIAIPDLHLGKLAWKPETGYSDYDVKIAEKLYDQAVEALIARTSGFAFKQIVFPVGNDLLHSDTKQGTTTKGTQLDTDSRYHKAFAIGRRLISRAIDRLRQIAPVKVVMVSGNHDCHDMETEILTRRGWVLFPDLRDNDQIFSLDKEERGHWTKINGKVAKPHAGSMIEMRSDNVDARVTPRHRVMARRVASKESRERYPCNQWKYIEAAKLKKNTYQIPVAAKESFSEGASLSDDQIALAAWILTDGSIRRKGNHVSFSLWQSKPNTEIERLLTSLGLLFTKRTRQREIKEIQGKILRKRPLPQVEWRLDAASSRRVAEWVPERGKLPDWTNDLSDAQWNIFFEAAIAGDGCWSTYSRRRSRKTSAVLYGTKEFLSSFQALAIQHGWRAWISPSRQAWKLNLARTYITGVSAKDRRVVVTSGEDTWCLIVPYGNFMVRRNGKPHISGNSLGTWHLGDSLTCLYHQTPDVEIMNDPTLRKYVSFGKVAILYTHGDRGKAADWPLLFATEQPKMFGMATFREIHTGHYHQTRLQEFHGVRVRISPALCPPDSWHADNQFVGNLRGAEAYVYHETEGLVSVAHFNVVE